MEDTTKVKYDSWCESFKISMKLVEMFNVESDLWENKTDYSFCQQKLVDYSTVSIDNFVLIIGGKCQKDENSDFEQHSLIAKFRNNTWTKAGNLMIPRRYHRSIVMNDRIYVVGGQGTQ